MIHPEAKVGDDSAHQGAGKYVNSVMPEIGKAGCCDICSDRKTDEWQNVEMSRRSRRLVAQRHHCAVSGCYNIILGVVKVIVNYAVVESIVIPCRCLVVVWQQVRHGDGEFGAEEKGQVEHASPGDWIEQC